MNKIETTTEAREAVQKAILASGAVSAIGKILSQMLLDDEHCEPQIADEFRSPFYRDHLLLAIDALTDRVAYSLESVEEYLDEPVHIRPAEIREVRS